MRRYCTRCAAPDIVSVSTIKRLGGSTGGFNFLSHLSRYVELGVGDNANLSSFRAKAMSDACTDTT